MPGQRAPTAVERSIAYGVPAVGASQRGGPRRAQLWLLLPRAACGLAPSPPADPADGPPPSACWRRVLCRSFPKIPAPPLSARRPRRGQLRSLRLMLVVGCSGVQQQKAVHVMMWPTISSVFTGCTLVPARTLCTRHAVMMRCSQDMALKPTNRGGCAIFSHAARPVYGRRLKIRFKGYLTPPKRWAKFGCILTGRF